MIKGVIKIAKIQELTADVVLQFDNQSVREFMKVSKELSDKLNSTFTKSTNSLKKMNSGIKKNVSSFKQLNTTSKKFNFSSSINKNIASLKKMNKELDKSKTMGGIGRSASAISGRIKTLFGIGAITMFSRSSVKAANVQVEAETKLASVLKNTKGVTDAGIESVKKYAGELQKVGVVGDEVALSGVQQLGTYQLQTKTLKTLMPGLEDLIAQQKGLNATTEDATNLGNMLGKVMTGQVGALSRAGINFNKAQQQILKYGTESQKAATLAEVLKQNVGGVNKALLLTDNGQIQQLRMSYGDMKEEIGKKLLPVMAELSTLILGDLPKIQEKILNVMDSLGGLYKKAKENKEIFIGLTKVAGVFIGTLVAIKGIKGTITAYNELKTGLIALKGVYFATTGALESLKIGYMLLADAEGWAAKKQVLLNLAMEANPVGLVIAGLTALIGVGYLVYKNWDYLESKIKDLWGTLKGFWKSLDNNPFTKLIKQVIEFTNPIFLAVKALKWLKKTWDDNSKERAANQNIDFQQLKQNKGRGIIQESPYSRLYSDGIKSVTTKESNDNSNKTIINQTNNFNSTNSNQTEKESREKDNMQIAILNLKNGFN